MPRERASRTSVTNGATNYTKEFAKIRQYRGLFSRVARELGVDRSFVSRVASGERQSERVSRALNREFARIERAAVKLQIQ